MDPFANACIPSQEEPSACRPGHWVRLNRPLAHSTLLRPAGAAAFSPCSHFSDGSAARAHQATWGPTALSSLCQLTRGTPTACPSVSLLGSLALAWPSTCPHSLFIRDPGTRATLKDCLLRYGGSGFVAGFSSVWEGFQVCHTPTVTSEPTPYS